MILQPIEYALAVVASAVAAVCMLVVIKWLDEEPPQGQRWRSKMKTFNVYGEFIITKPIITVEAETEGEATEKASALVAEMSKEFGTPEIVWAEEEAL